VRSVLLANVVLAALLVVPSRGMAQTALGAAQSYAVVGGSAVTAAGTGSVVTGDVGVSPGTAIDGFDGTAASIVPPFSAHANDGPAIAAQSSVDGLYTSLSSAAGCAPLAAQLDGVTLSPGVYCFSSVADLAGSGTLTLDGSGTYIFQVGSALTANVLSSVVLLNGADACDVFWQVTSAATLNGVTFVGNVVAQAGVTLGSGASLSGRALTTAAGAVTFAGSNTAGGCSGAATPTPTGAPTPTVTPGGGPTPVVTPTALPTSSSPGTPTPGQPTPAPTSSSPGTPTPTASSGQPTPVPTSSSSGPTPGRTATPRPTSSTSGSPTPAIPTPTRTSTPEPTATPFVIDDGWTSPTQPANSLVMPFDQSDGNASFFIVSNLSGVSPSGDGVVAAVTTHWAYWSENCDHLADVNICLTLNDTVVVSPSDVSAIGADNAPIGPNVDLSGHRGFVVVTAYATDRSCREASARGYLPVDDAIVGTYTFADLATRASFGNDAIGLGLDESESFTKLPGGLDPPVAFDKFRIQSFNPDDLDDSRVVLLSLKERSGSGASARIEVGPNTSETLVSVVYFDNLEIATSLPDASIKCATFTSMIPGEDALIPDTVSVLSSGFLHLDRFDPAIGGDTGRFVFGIHGQAVGNFGGSSSMKYRVSEPLD
jgi:hypothetical protein